MGAGVQGVGLRHARASRAWLVVMLGMALVSSSLASGGLFGSVASAALPTPGSVPYAVPGVKADYAYFSADGKILVSRWTSSLYVVDLVAGTSEQIAPAPDPSPQLTTQIDLGPQSVSANGQVVVFCRKVYGGSFSSQKSYVWTKSGGTSAISTPCDGYGAAVDATGKVGTHLDTSDSTRTQLQIVDLASGVTKTIGSVARADYYVEQAFLTSSGDAFLYSALTNTPDPANSKRSLFEVTVATGVTTRFDVDLGGGITGAVRDVSADGNRYLFYRTSVPDITWGVFDRTTQTTQYLPVRKDDGDHYSLTGDGSRVLGWVSTSCPSGYTGGVDICLYDFNSAQWVAVTRGGSPNNPLDASGGGEVIAASNYYGDRQLVLYGYTPPGTTSTTSTMPTTTTPAPKKVLFSFGDSIAAGEGHGTSSGYPNDNSSAYPAVLAKRIGWDSYNFAISGACTVNPGTPTGVPGIPATGTAPGCKDSKSILQDELPTAAQVKAHPDLISVTVGGNDIRFADCAGALIDSNKLDQCSGPIFDAHLAALRTNLSYIFQVLHERYPGVPIVATKYGLPVPPTLTGADMQLCAAAKDLMPALGLLQDVNSGQYVKAAQIVIGGPNSLKARGLVFYADLSLTASRIVGGLNKAIQQASTSKGVHLVDIDLTDHGLCEAYTVFKSYIFGPLVELSVVARAGPISKSFEGFYIPAERCMPVPGCDNSRLVRFSKSGSSGGFHYAIVGTFTPNDLPHLTTTGASYYATQIQAAVGI